MIKHRWRVKDIFTIINQWIFHLIRGKIKKEEYDLSAHSQSSLGDKKVDKVPDVTFYDEFTKMACKEAKRVQIYLTQTLI